MNKTLDNVKPHRLCHNHRKRKTERANALAKSQSKIIYDRKSLHESNVINVLVRCTVSQSIGNHLANANNDAK